jgi:hydrogenase maturation protein HypF
MAGRGFRTAMWERARRLYMRAVHYAGFRRGEPGIVSHPSSPLPGSSARREKLLIHGVVQGVGFRPFVYRLAQQEELAGFIGNDTAGVTIEIEGTRARVEAFRRRLEAEAPPLAHIDSVIAQAIAPTGEQDFRILASETHGEVSTGIPADAATCSDCLQELFDPADRRFRYPFLNCTHCGPRFTITRRIPYDRPQTSMAKFTMCAACQAEYDDAANRRFHAQPNACWECGPRLWLTAADGAEISVPDPIDACIDRLLAGEIAAIKGIGGFHLAADAANEIAVMRLRERKRRYGKPLAVMVRDLESARVLCVLAPEEEELLMLPARPIVLVRGRAGSGIAASVAPGIPWLGIFLPYAPLQHLLFAKQRVRALVMTSANLSEEPIAIGNEEARERLAKIADIFLVHDREILQRCDDSVMAVVDGAPQLLRRARGFVPLAIPLPDCLGEVPQLLAVGGHLKNVFTLARGRSAYQSQHLGDLENPVGLDFFRESLGHLMHTFEIEPQAVIHDLHPGYLSTSWARDWAADRQLPLVPVQHHHAHIAACMAEHGLAGPVIGLSLDGTGYGCDSRIWGGEVLLCTLDEFERFAHLEYVPMPGGEAAIREPWRMALGHLHAAGFDIESAEILELTGASAPEARILRRMIAHGLNTPLTSSCGRLFDAAAALVLGRREVDYEAQAAIELEGIAVDEPCELDSLAPYVLELRPGEWTRREPTILHAGRLWRAIVEDLRTGRPRRAHIAARFHAGVADGFARAAGLAREATGIRQVTMSGGCLQNARLARLLREGLERNGFEVFRSVRVSPGDGGLSYGQTVVAAAQLARAARIGSKRAG